jgi:hypothetical protein
MAGMATTVEGKLLCASACAYVTPQGNVLEPDAAEPYYGGAGFGQPPSAFLGGPNNINAALVGTTADGVVVAFRGTLPLNGPFTVSTLLDWVNDLNVQPVAGDGLPGQVHAGFLESLDALWGSVASEAQRQLAQAGPGASLFVTGHSKGGAISALAAMRFRTQTQLVPKVITFAAPKPGSKAFTDEYNAVIEHTRYEFADDVVPHLPPSASFLSVIKDVPFIGPRLPDLTAYDYERVGSLMYIEPSYEIVPDPQNTLLPERRLRLLNLIVRQRFQQIADDHRSACGYGYMTALCPTGVCP